MKHRIKLVAADMDGTLLNGDRVITKHTREVIEEVLDQGVHFVAATGRAVNALPEELSSMGKIRYGIFSNGATIYDIREKKVLYKNHFSLERVLELIKYLRQFDLMISVSQNGQSYGERKAMENLDYYQLDDNTRAIVKGSRKIVENVEDFIEEHKDTVEKMTLIFRTMEERAKVWEDLKRFSDIQYSSSLPKNLEISPKGCNKGDGLKHLAQILGIKQQETMAFGDADNDMEMLEEAGLSVVMENGLDSVKKIADYITDTNNHDGVAKAMEKFILEKNSE